MNKKIVSTVVTLGRWQVVKEENLLICGEEKLIMLPKVMKALEYFIEHPQQTITFDELNAAIWPNEVVGDNSIYNIIGQLRKALGDVASKPQYIETISKKGYRLVTCVKEDITECSRESGSEKEARIQDSELSYFSQNNYAKTVLIVVTLLLISLSFYVLYFETDTETNKTSISGSEKLPALAQQFISLAKYHQFKGNKDNKLIAIDYYKKLLALVPNNIEAQQEIAFINIELMSLIPLKKDLFFRKAKRAAEKAELLDIKQGNTQLLLVYLNNIEDMNNDSKAFELTYKALEQKLFQVSTSARLAYADFLFKRSQISEAIIQQRLAVKGCLTCAEVYRKLAISYMVNADFNEAAKYFEQYHELSTYDYSNPIKIVSQGSLSLKTLDDMFTWLANNPQKLTLKSQLNYQTLFYLNLGLFEQANNLTVQRNITEASDFFTLYTLAAVSGAKQNFEQSFIYLKKRHELFPKNTRFSISLSIAYWMMGDVQSALNILQNKVIDKAQRASKQSSPNESPYVLLYAALLKESGQKIKADKLLLNALELGLTQTPDNANKFMDLAIIYALLDQHEKALSSIKMSLNSGWVTDFNLSWWRLEDSPFLSSIKDDKAFKELITNYYEQLQVITSKN